MGKPYHVVSVSTKHSGGPEETEVLPAMYGRLAKVADTPNATGTARRKIRAMELRKTSLIFAILTYGFCDGQKTP